MTFLRVLAGAWCPRRKMVPLSRFDSRDAEQLPEDRFWNLNLVIVVVTRRWLDFATYVAPVV